MTRYLTLDELIYINGKLPGNEAILHGERQIRDIALLESAWGRPQHTVFGQPAFPTLPEKAAALLHSIARNHPFADGNKRTATVAALFMLAVNGLHVTWEAEEALPAILAVAQGQYEVEHFATWIPTVPCEPTLEPDTVVDKAIIDRLMATHHWLLRELDKQ
jgi:death on curing protein